MDETGKTTGGTPGLRKREESDHDESLVPADNDDRQFVAALARGLDVLRAFRPGYGQLGNQEIAEFTGLPKPTVSRLTYTLTKLGYLRAIPRLKKYELGAPVLSLGYAFLSNLQVRNLAQGMMQDLAFEGDVSVALGARDRLSMTYVANHVGRSTLALRIEVGTRVSLAHTALGRAFLAAIPDAERAYLMDHLARRYDGEWPALKKSIEGSIAQVHARGFCVVDGEWRQHVRAAGVPVIFPHNSGVMAMNCAGASMNLSAERLERECGPRLVHIARNVESMMTRP